MSIFPNPGSTMPMNQYLRIMYMAWIMPGMYPEFPLDLSAPEGNVISDIRRRKYIPRMVKRTLSQKVPLQPRSISTPTGGRMTAKMILQMSLAVNGMVKVGLACGG